MALDSVTDRTTGVAGALGRRPSCRVRLPARRRRGGGRAPRPEHRDVGAAPRPWAASLRAQSRRLGAPGRTRTCDHGIRKPMLCPLSYGGSRAERNRRLRGTPGTPGRVVRSSTRMDRAWMTGPAPCALLSAPGGHGRVRAPRCRADRRRAYSSRGHGERTHRVRTAGADRVLRDVGYSRRRDAVGPGVSRGPASQPIGRAGPGPPGNALEPDRVAWESPRRTPSETAREMRVWSSFENSTVCRCFVCFGLVPPFRWGLGFL